MKRTTPSSGRKTHIPSDFKRLKAKVGKRAPQKANVTETKFRTASVQVRTQTINDSNKTNSNNNQEGEGGDDKKNATANVEHEMISSKGKLLFQLLGPLNTHPSPSVRISSLQGVKDATKNTPVDAIPNYLSVLVPALSKSMVDDDSKVRKLAMSIFFQDITTRIVENHSRDKMRPFLPLSLAYIASALHSLDQDVRYDGCVALENLCANFGNELKGEKELHSLLTTVPAFVTLFDDVSGGVASVARRGMADIGSTGSNSKKKQKKKKNQSRSNDKSVGVLRSFISILQITTQPGDNSIDSNKTWVLSSDQMRKLTPNGLSLLPSLKMPDLKFLPGGVASNAIVWNHTACAENGREKSLNMSLKGIHDLSYMTKFHEPKYSVQEKGNLISIGTQIDLLSKVRNRLVELTQKGNGEGPGGLSISSHEVHEFSLSVSALRLVWNCHPQYFHREEEANRIFLSRDGKVNQWKKFKKLAHLLLNMSIEILPVQDPSGNPTNQHNYDVLNASLCCAISEFGSVLEPPDNSSNRTKWVDVIFSYLLPKLRDDDITSNVIIGEEITKSTQRNSRVTLLKVVEQLILKQGSDICFLNDEEKQIELLNTFASIFFSNENKPTEKLCRSLEGRRAVQILLSLIAQFFRLKSINNDLLDESEMWKVLSGMSRVLPIYLIMWRGSFPNDSTMVLSTLLSISRRCDATRAEKTSSLSIYCMSIREYITSIFTTPSMSEHVSFGSTTKSELSVFEELQVFTTQKLAVSLLGLLHNPPPTVISSLAQICARHNVNTDSKLSDEIVDYITSVLHSVKSNIDFDQYCSFLIESTGLSETNLTICNEKEGENDAINNNSTSTSIIYSRDKSLSRLCRYLCLALDEDKKIIPTIKPYLMIWLQGGYSSTILRKLQARAAISIISCWSLLLSETSCNFYLEKDLETAVVRVTCDLFLSSSSIHKEHNCRQLMSPMMTLFRQHPSLLSSTFVECGKVVAQSNGKNDACLKVLISNLLHLVSDIALLDTIRRKDVSDVIAKSVHSIENSTSNGSLEIEMIVGSLAIQVKSVLGFK
mmetsp:Transcript_5052/g.7444  ORF Transcript_5052/g.7444 Transcript_5052/m.7444 type:complete len:1053 (+) Transcript_5052:71-3229(+)